MTGCLDADAKLYLLLVAGVRVEVVRGAPLELVALADLAADHQADGHRADPGRDPGRGAQKAVALFLFDRFDDDGHGVGLFGRGTYKTEWEEGLHGKHHNATPVTPVRRECDRDV